MTADRVRIYDLARELGTPNKVIINTLKDHLNVSVKSHSSTIGIDEANKLKTILKSGKQPEKTTIKKLSEEEQKEAQKKERLKRITITHPKIVKPAPEVKQPAPEVKPETPIEVKTPTPEIQKPTPEVKPETPVKVQPAVKPETTTAAQEEIKTPTPETTTAAQEEIKTPTPEIQKLTPEAPPAAEVETTKPELEEPRKPITKPQHISSQEKTDTQTSPRPYKISGDKYRHKPAAKPTEESDANKPGTKRLQYMSRTQTPRTVKPQQKPLQPPVKKEFPKPSEETRTPEKPKFTPSKPKPATATPAKQFPARPAKGPYKKEGIKKKDGFKKDKFQDLKPLNEVIKKKKTEKKVVVEEKPTEIYINGPLTIAELASMLVTTSTEIIKELMMIGIFATLNETISEDVAKDVSKKLGYEVLSEAKEVPEEEKEETKQKEEDEAPEEDNANLVPRAPIVTILGHVDHGKTTLLDAIRKSKHKLVDSEVGGITQTIGAYTVKLDDNKKIIFVDTPGHHAFTAMRARGAQVTDIAILIVAADDGIMPQTVEAINHAKAAEVPIIVAVNKIDKAGADPDRILQQLTEHGLLPEAWGGDTVTVNISALKGDNLDGLLEMISIVAEVQELKANPNKKATGVVIESELDKGKGPVAAVIVQDGTLKVGNHIIVGSIAGKVRALINDHGERITEAGPCTPLEILGLSEVPQAGDLFRVVDDDKKAKQLVSKLKIEERERRLSTVTAAKLQKETIFKAKMKKDGEDKVKELNIIIKADTNGSVQAVETVLQELQSKEVVVKTLHTGIGDISEADVMLASTSNAIIIGFRVKEDPNISKVFQDELVEIRTYEIIYQISEDIEKTMLGLLKPKLEEVELGTAEVRNLFTVGKNLVIAGCYVLDGKMVRNRTAVVLRNNKEIFRGTLDNLKRFKDDAKEVQSGFECGISFNKFNDLKEGDLIKVSHQIEIERENLN